MWAERMTSAHFSVLSWMNLPNSAEFIAIGFAPSAANSALIVDQQGRPFARMKQRNTPSVVRSQWRCDVIISQSGPQNNTF
jgi:hypothetical protein